MPRSPHDSSSEPRLGVTVDGHGVRFALRSQRATAVELCLYEAESGAAATRRLPLERASDGVWSVFVEGAGHGLRYGYRVDGPWEPAAGDRFDPAKLLVDPYALAVTGEPRLDPALHGGARGASGPPRGADTEAAMPRSIVVDVARLDWEGDRPPRTPWADTLIYEAHVRGLTRQHPEVPENERGSYLGLAHPAVLEHLLSLGVTAVELLPVQQIASEPFLLSAGRSNYFGYSPLALAAPHAGYATASDGRQVEEFQQMVRALHAAGLEVILDVVFNHTAEGGAGGPTLSLRGVDNRAYYRLDPRDRARYIDHSGCGNSLDASRPAVERLVLDALRHWVEIFHVDGFRFDLAVSLGRDREGRFRSHDGLLAKIASDPVLAGVKLVAEPWDLGPDGYRAGEFPEPWREWDDRFRDRTRAFWRGDATPLEAIAGAIGGDAGSPTSRIAFVTCHDGFTLADLTSYDEKHNEANGEANRDGSDHNLSRNWGVEGPTGDPEIVDLRRRAARGLLFGLAIARGVPMLAHGDELGRTQGGNNNAYCQDGPLAWVDWRPDGETLDLLAFARTLLERRRDLDPNRRPPPTWLAPDGRVVAGDPRARRGHALGALWEGAPATVLALVNGGDEAVHFRLPPAAGGWRVALSTGVEPVEATLADRVRLEGHTAWWLEPVAPSSSRRSP